MGAGTSKNPSAPNEQRLSNTPTDACIDMLSAEQLVKDYLVKSGLVPEEGLGSATRAQKVRERRMLNYLNVESLLKQYRNLSKTYDVFLEDFAAQLQGEAHITSVTSVPLKKNAFFEAISERLQLVDAADERRFARIYAPQIATGKRIGAALEALDFGLRVLEKQDKEAYQLLRRMYIDGDSAPTIREIIAEFQFSGNSTYYAKMENARKKLTKAIFGFASRRAELTSILVYLRQQAEDDAFPEF